MTAFAVEKTLGKLAKWLRLLGFDAIYEGGLSADEKVAYTAGERILLTRTQRVQPGVDARRRIRVEANDPFAQLLEIIRALDIRLEDIRPFSRCILCNTPIEAVDKAAVRNLVPDYVWQQQEKFRRCPRCRKIYWSGSHIDRSMQRIKKLFQPHEPWNSHAK